VAAARDIQHVGPISDTHALRSQGIAKILRARGCRDGQ
jgi:hypothetical protein